MILGLNDGLTGSCAEPAKKPVSAIAVEKRKLRIAIMTNPSGNELIVMKKPSGDAGRLKWNHEN
jgi:hypothetical protein